MRETRQEATGNPKVNLSSKLLASSATWRKGGGGVPPAEVLDALPDTSPWGTCLQEVGAKDEKQLLQGFHPNREGGGIPLPLPSSQLVSYQHLTDRTHRDAS